ncbi:helix-turn-helix domain-containing protein [Ponticoccus sp. SC2-23]|uniref:MerR family transcriptional regulator n=1 Tax=Alexandriicola marinus TaxID=2081710 RepID=UPI000FDB6D05|nr:helix-turn-helix domain-containing protein [Alexandriicola marinus]MBM1219313.1 helix-turn-helix domain-containing protein [Ponticoccus sp. SC6-9]MBM1223615.1 helix-turn-helix domain-containing protein [Ponticoccus sp. SC6-15]MBM1229126.1 helix-turn-helix domain-containing protein [Ponticoccus sp. SC6-38]MBM1232581.1 helix-turn-helix domain-containing protein [Ponticoccus sp. SC6-45]MBM1237469.1 helix-turn-helix domain-containing protein [Ponticoccus sp. SC6-49]MBM1241592.1 helix-turn-heli
MFSIGELSRRTGVKVPTIRYYEEIGLLTPAGRSAGNQRRYDAAGLERLGFIRHARALGFGIDEILSLIDLQQHPDRSCQSAMEIAEAQLAAVRDKIAQLRSLEQELSRIADGCEGSGPARQCYVLRSLSDHGLCSNPH